MNCQNYISKLGFQCLDLGGETLRIWSPFNYWNDGQLVGLYLEKMTNGYRITDNCESFMHASSMGINLSLSKLNAVRRAAGPGVSLSDGGEIASFVSEEDLGRGLSSVLGAALAVANFESQWTPKNRTDSFVKVVASALEEVVGDRLLRKVSIKGASGHQLELPLAVRGDSALVYIQPIAVSDEGKIDWKNVYAGFGRMVDLKNAGVEGSFRTVVLEESANDSDMKQAALLLAESASVVRYTDLQGWARKRFG